MSGDTNTKRQSAGEGMRSMPHDAESERALLSSCLILPDCIDAMAAYPPELFYDLRHQMIFKVIRAMREAGMPIDFVLLAAQIEKANDGIYELNTVLAMASELFTFLPSAGNFDFYVERCREAWQCRKMIDVGTRIAARGYAFNVQADMSIEEELSEVEAEIFSLRDSRKIDEDIKDSKTLGIELYDNARFLFKNRGSTIGIPTGFHDMDRMLGGFLNQELTLLAARPSQGKSAMAMNMLRHAIFGDGGRFAGVPVGLFSLEMPAVDQMKRLACDIQNIDLHKFRDGFFSQEQLDQIFIAAQKISKAQLYVDETPNLSVQEWRVKARRMVSKYGVRLIFVDYLQLMRSSSKRAQMNRQVEVAEISTILKTTARELNIPIVALAQLTRDAENRVPTLANLRESGQLEQDADVVIFIHRPEKGKRDEEGEIIKREEAKAIIAKQRNGPTGDMDLDFLGHVTRFENVTEKRYSNNKEKRQGAVRKPKSQTPDRYMDDAE
jgi:replicative DNA helicase